MNEKKAKRTEGSNIKGFIWRECDKNVKFVLQKVKLIFSF